MRRRSMGSILVSNLDPDLKDRILNLPVKQELLKKFDDDEKREDVTNLVDLRDLKLRTETEVYNTLNRMYKNKQFFMYCGPLLININPGPNYVNDYLNLEAWKKETKNLPDNRWKPHLYSFGNYVYQTLVNENKDQVINMLGQIGSGKTFNLIHLMEYMCHLGSEEGYQTQIFDVIHKSVQLIHMLGSIFRQNNIESTSCGMLLRLGFNDAHKICNFDLEAKILDFTLPFSQNGRTFSILHSLMTGANSEIKKLLDLPEFDHQLNFFKKFTLNFDFKTKDRFKLNDLEIWTKFHSLLGFFQFNKNEIIELLQLLSFILLCNEAAIGKKKTAQFEPDEFLIVNKGHSSRKLSKMLNMPEEDFLKKFGTYKDLNEIKNVLISLMKSTYYMIFDFVKTKIKSKLKSYFEKMNGRNFPTVNKSNLNHSFSTPQNIKYINFIDFPGEVEDQTLGGLSTNLANECLNVFAGTQYLSVVEKLEEEKLNLKYFQPLQCYHAVESLLTPNGIFGSLSQPFTEENFRKLQHKAKNLNHFQKTTEFNENQIPKENGFQFNVKFSHVNIQYNYESLYMETKSFSSNKKIINLFSSSKNSIVKSTYKKIIDPNKNFYDFTVGTIKELFKPLEGLSPFVIYCLHSNNSQKIFFGEKYLENREEWVIPLNLTVEMLKNSLAIPVLYWEWFGFHEWVQIQDFVREFATDFEKIKDKLLKVKKIKDLSLNQLNDFEISTYILSVLGNDKSYILGANHILLKQGTLKLIRNLIDKMLDMIKAKAKNPITDIIMKVDNNTKRTSLNSNKRLSITDNIMQNHLNSGSSKRSISSIGRRFSGTSSNKVTPSGDSRKSIPLNKLSNREIENPNTSFSFQHQKKNSSDVNEPKPTQGSKNNIPCERKHSMKVQCHLNIIDNIKNMIDINNIQLPLNTGHCINMLNIQDANSNIYNLFQIIDRKNKEEKTINSSMEVSVTGENINEINYEKFKRNNNIILSDKQNFDEFKDLLDNENFKIFDYNDYLLEIKRIQTAFRSFKARRKYKIYRYVIKKIVSAQRLIRGFIIRKKFTKFLYCHKCIVKIQAFYRKKLDFKHKAAIKIQKCWRRKKCVTKLVSMLQEQIPEGAHDNALDSNRFLYFNFDLLKDTNKKNPQIGKIYGTLSKEELEKETDKDKIIEYLLVEQALAKHQNPIINQGLREKSGISRRLKKSMNQTANAIKKANPKIQKIEDKLIEIGETVKLKKAEKKLELMKIEEAKFSFKPEVHPQISYNQEKQVEGDFLSRMEFYKKRQEKKLEEIKNKCVDPSALEYTFKPQVSELAKGMKRNRDDLFNWKQKKDELNMKKQHEKEYKEMLEIEKSTTMPKINKNSELLVRQKQERNMKEKMIIQQNDENEEFDLWPVMEKNYFEK